MTSGNWSIGSCVELVTTLMGASIPSSISGTSMNPIVENEINYIELYTTSTINSSSIPEKYQPVLLKLVQADVLISAESQQGGIDNVSIGELSVSQGAGGGAQLAQQLKNEAIERLKELQRVVRFKRVIGG